VFQQLKDGQGLQFTSMQSHAVPFYCQRTHTLVTHKSTVSGLI